LTANALGEALYSNAFAEPDRPVNLARFVFLDPASQTFYANWPAMTDAAVGSLRVEVVAPVPHPATKNAYQTRTRHDEGPDR
jgi:hypothetical protein